MNLQRLSGIPLFKLFGIQVFLHWTWFVAAMFEIQTRGKSYQSMAWNAIEYLCLFLIVLTHEFGHALACRSVGGRADKIVLWPLGGIAFVDPPQRPGAVLWSIVAGPLVNVILVPITFGAYFWVSTANLAGPDVQHFLLSSTCCRSTRWMAGKSCGRCCGFSSEAHAA
jgi:Zn-dependent protease